VSTATHHDLPGPIGSEGAGPSGLDRTVAETVRPVAAGLALVFLGVGIASMGDADGAMVGTWTIVALGLALAYASLFAALPLRKVPPGSANRILATMFVIAGGVEILHMLIARTTVETTTVTLIAVAAGVVLLSRLWLGVVLGVISTGWVLALVSQRLTHPRSAVALAAGVALAIAIHEIRFASLARLDRTHRYYREILDNSLDVLTVMEPDRTNRYNSPSLQRILGWTPEERAGRPVFELVHPDDRERVVKAAEDAVNQPGISNRVEYRIRAKDGSYRVLESIATNLVDDPAVAGAVIASRDITERRQAEEALTEAERRFRTLVEQIPAVTYVDPPDVNADSVYVSPQLRDLLGVEPEAWLKDPEFWHRHVHPEDEPRVWAAWTAAAEQGVEFRAEYRMVRDDGAVVWVNERSAPVEVAPGSTQYQGVLFDVTDQKRDEEMLRESETELRRSLEVLQRADDERRQLLGRLLEAEERERRRMAEGIEDASLQHVAALGMRLEGLRRRVDDPDQLGAIDKMGATVAEATQRLRRLLLELRPRSLDLDGLGPAVAQFLRDLTSGSEIRLLLDDRLEREPDIEARTVAYRIIRELVARAIGRRATSRIGVALANAPDGIHVSVTDDGELDQHLLDDEQLWIGSTTQRAELAGGSLEVHEIDGERTFELRLPSKALVAAP
jgi:PAS domain S-box-containing protein